MPDVAETTEWYDILGRFKAKAAEFGAMYNRLLASDPKGNLELEQQRERLLSFGDTVKEKVMTLTSSVDTAYNWVKNTIGLGELGFIPAIVPVAAAGVAVAAMTKFISDALIYFDKADRWERIAKEHGAKAATSAITGLDPPMFGGAAAMLKSLLPFLMIGGAVYFYRDKLFKGKL